MSKIEDGVIGLALGDALGVPCEFLDRASLEKKPIKKMVGYGTHNVEKGCFSDDTTMTICLMQSIIDCGKIDYDDIMHNFYLWIKEAKFTATNKVFDVGQTCLNAIFNYGKEHQEPLMCGLDGMNNNGNGSLMRILPLAYYCFYKKLRNDEIFEYVKNISSLTHRHEISILGCFIYVLFVLKLLEGNDIKTSYAYIQNFDYVYFSKKSLIKYQRILKEDLSLIEKDKIKSSGYVVDTLEASLWSLMTTSSFNDALICAVNLGEDTDTIGAITGSLAGIVYGYNSFSKEWLKDLLKLDYLKELCCQYEEILVHC